MTQSWRYGTKAKMALVLLLLIQFITLSNSDLIFNVQPSTIVSAANETIIANCSTAADWVPANDTVASLFLGRLNVTTNETQDVISLSFNAFNLAEFTQIYYIENTEAKFGANYLSLTLYQPRKSDAGIYYCEGYGVSKQSRIRVSKTLEFQERELGDDEHIESTTEGTLRHEAVYVTNVTEKSVRESFDAAVLTSTEKAIQISVLPSEISGDSFLRDFQVTCNFSRIRSPNMIQIFSVIVSQSTRQDLPVYKDLLTITILEGRISKLTDGTFNYTFDSSDEGELSLQLLLDPRKYKRTGLYKCEVNGIDSLGKPLKVFDVTSEDYIDIILEMFKTATSHKESIQTENAEIVFLRNELTKTKQSFKRLTDNYKELVKQLGALLGRVEDIQNELYVQRTESFTTISEVSNLTALQSTINTKVDTFESVQKTMQKSMANLSKHVTRLESSIGHVDNKLKDNVNECTLNISKISEKVEALRATTEDPNSIFNASLNSLFIPSAPYHGRKYWLTRTIYKFFVTDAEVMCRRYGGYLVEIDSEEEFEFLRNFIRSQNKPFEFVITGGTDAATEGQWVNRFTYNSVATFVWGAGEPKDDSNENCQCFYKSIDWMMGDCNCSFDKNENCGFLCEISE